MTTVTEGPSSMFVRMLVAMVLSAGLLVPVGSAAQAAPDRYTPRQGVTFNNPVGGRQVRRAIYRKIMRSINSSPRGSEIYFFTWNFLTSGGADALLRAQRRGVQVKVLMDDRNVTEIDNPPFRRLKRGLRQGNKDRRKERRSWARLCEGSCRGGTGSAHSKFFMFSKAGKARNVVIQGSANFTLASTNNQWNDVYTHVNNKAVWRFADRTFREAARDQKAKPVFIRLDKPSFSLFMYPIAGKNAVDPVGRLLGKVRCRNATNTRNGRTVIRIAPDVIRHDRGMWLARKVRKLWNDGCDVKIGYTVVGIKIGRMLRSGGGRGPVPMKHLVQDFDGDGEFDNYFHLKSMTIRGNVNGDRSNTVVLNGSANWSGLAKVSDENVGVYWRPGVVSRYQKHIEYWYKNFPSDGNPRIAARTKSVDDDRLIFGSGRNAVYEDGEPVGDGTFDPFAKLELD